MILKVVMVHWRDVSTEDSLVPQKGTSLLSTWPRCDVGFLLFDGKDEDGVEVVRISPFYAFHNNEVFYQRIVTYPRAIITKLMHLCELDVGKISPTALDK
jgi:hypothetical protein